MSMNKEQLIQGIYNEYMGKRDQTMAELQVYLDSPAGVGEHGGISDVVSFSSEAPEAPEEGSDSDEPQSMQNKV